jgi:hypothetical protein
MLLEQSDIELTYALTCVRWTLGAAFVLCTICVTSRLRVIYIKISVSVPVHICSKEPVPCLCAVRHHRTNL